MAVMMKRMTRKVSTLTKKPRLPPRETGLFFTPGFSSYPAVGWPITAPWGGAATVSWER